MEQSLSSFVVTEISVSVLNNEELNSNSLEKEIESEHQAIIDHISERLPNMVDTKRRLKCVATKMWLKQDKR